MDVELEGAEIVGPTMRIRWRKERVIASMGDGRYVSIGPFPTSSGPGISINYINRRLLDSARRRGHEKNPICDVFRIGHLKELERHTRFLDDDMREPFDRAIEVWLQAVGAN